MRSGLSYSEAGKLGQKASREIQQKQKAERVKQYYSDPRQCQKCCAIIPYEKRVNKYCSRSCAASVNNLGVRRHGCHNDRGVENCLNCGVALVGKRGRKYCSRRCASEHRWQYSKEAIARDPNSVHIQTLRRFIMEERDSKCEKCGGAVWFGEPMPLELHHIDGNHKNNDFNNLMLLCPNCHALTPTFKNKNIGNGRAIRMQRYRAGKSY